MNRPVTKSHSRFIIIVRRLFSVEITSSDIDFGVMTRVVLEVDEKKCHMAKKMCFLVENTMLEI